MNVRTRKSFGIYELHEDDDGMFLEDVGSNGVLAHEVGKVLFQVQRYGRNARMGEFSERSQD